MDPTLPFEPLPVDFSAIDAVVFDIGGVFLYPHYSPVKRRLTELDLPVPEGHEAFRKAHHLGALHLWEKSGTDDELRTDFWEVYDNAYAQSLGVPESLQPDLRVAMRVTWSWPHAENVLAFHSLAASGMSVAILSNNNGTAPVQMRDHRICQVGPGPLPEVAAIVDSSHVGVAKPDPAIFSHAFSALGTDPARTLYIGDTIHADVQGATAANMPVAQLDPFDHHAAYPHTRLRDLAHLNAQLGVSATD